MQHIILLCWKSSEQIIKLDAEGFVLGLQKEHNIHAVKLNLM